MERTAFHSPPSKPETRQDHLAQPERGTEAREEAHGHDAEEVEEEADEHGIGKPQIKQRVAQNANSERAHDHVGSEPLKPGGVRFHSNNKHCDEGYTMLPILK